MENLKCTLVPTALASCLTLPGWVACLTLPGWVACALLLHCHTFRCKTAPPEVQERCGVSVVRKPRLGSSVTQLESCPCPRPTTCQPVHCRNDLGQTTENPHLAEQGHGIVLALSVYFNLSAMPAHVRSVWQDDRLPG
eukprot:366272-Chlamydomonas_euryale.AAC.5